MFYCDIAVGTGLARGTPFKILDRLTTWPRPRPRGDEFWRELEFLSTVALSGAIPIYFLTILIALVLCGCCPQFALGFELAGENRITLVANNSQK